MRSSVQSWLVACLLLAASPGAPAALVVAEVRPNRAAPAASIQPGDRLERAGVPGGAGFELLDCGDWRRLETALISGEIPVQGTRGTQAQRWILREGDLQLRFDTRALAPAPAAECELREALLQRDAARAASLATRFATASPHALDVFVRRDLVETALLSGRAVEASAMLDAWNLDAVAPALAIEVRMLRASAFRDGRNPERALELGARNVADAKALAPRSLLHARAVLAWANLHADADSIPALAQALEAARAACEDCRELAEAEVQQAWRLFTQDRDTDGRMLALSRSAADILASIRSMAASRLALRYSQISQVATAAGEPLLAERWARQALASDPDGGPAAEAEQRISLSIALKHQGRNREALAEYERAYALRAATSPQTADRAKHNLALIEIELGNLGRAEDLIRDTLAWIIAATPGTLDEARARRSLARARELRGDWVGALQEIEAALALERKAGATGELYANTLLGRGRVQTLAGDLDAAGASLDEALAAAEKLFDGECVCLGEGLLGAGWLEVARGNAAAAATHFERARGIYAKAVPSGTAYEGEALHGLAEARLLQDDPRAAGNHLAQAVRLLEREAPDQAILAFALNARARAQAALGRHESATHDYCIAAETLQRAGRRVGSDSLVQALFRNRHADLFRDCVEATLRTETPEAALLRLESMRSRTFLEALAAREIAPRTADAGERDLLARADAARRERGRIQRRLAQLDVPREERLALENELAELGERRRGALARLKQVAPELAALEGASGTSLRQMQTALPDGMVALEYAVGFADTLLFVVRRDGVQVHRLPLGSAELTRRVGEFRTALLQRDPAGIDDLRRRGAVLFETLIAPAHEALASARTVLLAPEGPLFDLPFAALWDGRDYLGARWPLVFSDSLTTWTHLAHRETARRSARRLAVADAPGAAARGHELPPLPGARVEVQALHDGAPALTDLLLGTEASEARVRQTAPSARLLHFAVHAVLDAERPLDSALVLAADDASRPAADGLLHVAEVLEQLDLAADLVVLSGCDTGRGEALQGEGLIGFTRAFEFAGADAVLATLWPVSDRPTAEFMQAFYAALDGGAPPPLALQSAVKQTLASPVSLADVRTRGAGGLVARGTARVHPYVWAGFQLYGGAR